LGWGQAVDQEGGGDRFPDGDGGRDADVVSLSDVFYGREDGVADSGVVLDIYGNVIEWVDEYFLAFATLPVA